MRKFLIKAVFLSILGLLTFSCEGENGAIGPDGVDGVDGVNGVGFEDLVKFGSITINLEETGPDGMTFTDTGEFKFLSTEASDIDTFNSFIPGTDRWDFNVLRFISAPDDVFQESTVRLNLDVLNPGESNEDMIFDLQISDYTIVTEDNKFFGIDYTYDENSVVSPVQISDFNFNEATNRLTLSFSFTVSDNF